ncbi:MAG: NAD(P)-binding protein [Bacteroidales bacterium]|nr:NAD(P)-binding protein [Bacteroidales bacterium]
MDLIIGAGISGLSYAAATQHDYLILERDNAIGGYCKTIYDGDYIWDYSGHFFHFQHEYIKDYVMEKLSEEEVLKVNKYTQIYYKGLHVDFPFQTNIHQLEKEEFIDCLYDLFTVEENPKVETFKEMLYAKFGKSIAEKFLIPYNSKLYATDLNNLDVDAMGRFFPYADKEQIVRNFRNSTNKSYNSFFIYPKQGCIKVVEAVASRVDTSKIAFGESLIGVDLQRKIAQTNKREIHFDNLISTIPFPLLMDMAGMDYDRSIYSWNKVLVFNLGFDSKGPERQNCWLYFPDPELIFYRVGFYDNILGQDKTSLYVEIGFNHNDPIGDTSLLLERTLNDLRKAGIITDQKLAAHSDIVMDPAYVHITKKSEEDKKLKQKQLAASGVYSIGRYGDWKYCSLEDNIHDAFTLAKDLQ